MRRPLVADGERGQAVDLVAPQVDAHRLVRRGGEDVDDPAAHGELPAVLHLVLAPVAPGDQLGQKCALVDPPAATDHERCRPLQRAQPLEQGADRGHDDAGRRRQRAAHGADEGVEQGEAPPHGLGLGAHTLERQGLPRRQDGHRAGESAHHLARLGVLLLLQQAGQIVPQALGVQAGGGDDEERGPLGERRQRGGHDGLRRLGDRDGGIGRAHEHADHRVGAQQAGDGGQAAGGTGACGRRAVGGHRDRPRWAASGTTPWRRRCRPSRCARPSPPPSAPRRQRARAPPSAAGPARAMRPTRRSAACPRRCGPGGSPTSGGARRWSAGRCAPPGRRPP